VHNHSKIIQW